MIDFIIIENTDKQIVEKEIIKKLNDGYKLSGDLIVSVVPGVCLVKFLPEYNFVQAMIKTPVKINVAQ